MPSIIVRSFQIVYLFLFYLYLFVCIYLLMTETLLKTSSRNELNTIIQVPSFTGYHGDLYSGQPVPDQSLSSIPHCTS